MRDFHDVKNFHKYFKIQSIFLLDKRYWVLVLLWYFLSIFKMCKPMSVFEKRRVSKLFLKDMII